MSVQESTRRIVFALREHGEDMDKALTDELSRLAQEAARAMQRLVAKGRSALWASIHVEPVSPTEQHVRPGAAHAWYVEKGVKPGGKGLPRFFDPASASVVDWLRSHPAGGGKVRAKSAPLGSKVMQATNLDLRDRYEGLAWHIRHYGVKAQPFVEPVAKDMETVLPRRMELVVRRVLAQRPGGAA